MLLLEFGSNRMLALAEGLTYARNTRSQVKAVSENYLVLQQDAGLKPRFGSILRLAHLIGDRTELKERLSTLVLEHPVVEWSVRVLDKRSGLEDSQSLLRCALKETGVRLRMLKGGGRREDGGTLSVTKAVAHRMNEEGFEFLVTSIEGSQLFWRTVEYIPLASYKRIDMMRPFRAPCIALPSSLARSMINLAWPSADDYLLDPFCGSGTILMEASNSVRRLFGVDRDRGVLAGCNRNLDWYTRGTDYTLKRADSLNLRRVFPNTLFSCIVTEPPLGPPLRKPITVARANALRTQLETFYREALSSFASVTKPGGKVVITLPSWVTTHGDSVDINVQTVISGSGLFIDRDLEEHGVVYPIRWAKPDNVVQRLIVVLKKPSS